jgi:hypothetical protein
MTEGFGSVHLTDPDPGGQKTYRTDSTDPDPQQWFNLNGGSAHAAHLAVPLILHHHHHHYPN